jgi:hypothetical protein
MINDREAYVPGFDLEGRFLPDQVRAALRADLLRTEFDTDEQIQRYVNEWLRSGAAQKHQTPVSLR